MREKKGERERERERKRRKMERKEKKGKREEKLRSKTSKNKNDPRLPFSSCFLATDPPSANFTSLLYQPFCQSPTLHLYLKI